MSICVNTVFVEKTSQQKEAKTLNDNIKHKVRVVLRCRDDISKPQCDRTLKRKLKKYKLRKHGEEDQEILDVSKTFISSLIIKSTNKEMSTAAGTKCKLKKSEVKQSCITSKRKKDVMQTKSQLDPKSISPTQSSNLKNQTNAFKVLMDSRNKVIGSNSPGKDRIFEECELQEVTEKKELKIKRTMSLKKMAQAKGALKKQEQEESREKYVKNELVKRGERLKNMILKPDSHSSKSMNSKYLSEPKDVKLNQTPSKTQIVSSKDDSLNNSKSDTLLNACLSDTLNHNISKEEMDFLKKLSPSLRKKENMLCYFNVVTKETECESVLNENDDGSVDKQSIIKVKITSKSKKKIKQDKNVADVTPVLTNESKTNETKNVLSPSQNLKFTEIIKDRKKRKRKKHINESESANSVEVTSTDSRPKRNTRKPIKYNNPLSSSSDEEFHIFTPKKKKGSVTNVEQTQGINNEDTMQKKSLTLNKCTKNHPKKAFTKKSISPVNIPVKKSLKLAPIFTPKPQLTAEELKAKQEFLHSGIPNHVKKNKKRQDTSAPSINSFQPVVHIQQINPTHVKPSTILSLQLLHCDNESDVTNVPPVLFKNLLRLNTTNHNVTLDFQNSVKTLLKTMKNLYSKFPVYRTYHSLKAKSRGEIGDSQCTYLDSSVEIVNGILDTCNDNPDKLKWTDKYKATSTKQIIGNFDSIKELRKWLISWTENDVPEQKDSDSSDFCYSDTDSGDVKRMRNNLLILTGKTGSGKTSSVYAVASELSIKVIEVNASSKRTGKIMLQDLQEATQSHKVDRQRDGFESSQKSVDTDTNIIPQIKKRGRPKKQILENLSQKSLTSKKDSNSEPFSSQESLRTVMSLILIDDADVVFEQDDGFCSAIAQLVHSSKRPVILITESVHCPHLQKFLKYSQVINLQPFLPRMLGMWLDIMCLADSSICYPGLGAKFLDFFKGDIRKTINCLQFYMTSHRHILKQENASQENDFIDAGDDEGSSMSWAVKDEVENRTSTSICNSRIQYFLDKLLNMHNPSPFLTYNVWWSLPQFLNFNLNDIRTSGTKEAENLLNDKLKLEMMSLAIDTLSVVDMFENTTAELHANITSKPWFSPESASLLESENFESYNRNSEVGQDISHFLMTDSIQYAQKILKCEHITDIQFPSLTLQRERDKILNRHKSLTSYLNPSATLDRKAVSLDYWPSCRNICRIERTKTDLSNKRNNRFCHYLKSLNVLCSNDYFDKFGESLCSDEKL